jgi:hypothetical protein
VRNDEASASASAPALVIDVLQRRRLILVANNKQRHSAKGPLFPAIRTPYEYSLNSTLVSNCAAKMQRVTSILPSWDKTKTGSKKGFDKAWQALDKCEC